MNTSWMRGSFLLLCGIVIPACGTTNPQTSSQLSFGGLTSATPGAAAGQVNLVWSPAIDLNGGSVVYDVFQTNVGSGMENLGSPTYQTSSGTGFTVSGLNSANHYWFIVQAQDSTGHVDGNTLEIEVIAP
jgi:hypothetical protein